MNSAPFWLTKRLDEMNGAEWESLCDGCALCCLEKYQDIESGDIVFSATPCYQLDLDSCRCKVYARRHAVVPGCVPVRPDDPEALRALPSTCAYRLVYEGRDLPDWHPLKSGDPDSARRAGVGVGAMKNLLRPLKPWKRWRGR